MSDPRWTVDEDGDIVFGDAVAEIVHEADTPHAVKKAAYTALVECVRSHDTLTRARTELERQLDKHRRSEETTEAGRTLKRGLILGCQLALDLLTGEGQ